mgnify:CR=1 FL=1
MGKGATLFPFFVSLPQMTNRKTILYIHGMGGGGDSRIPSVLREYFHDCTEASSSMSVQVACHTYDFDPEVAAVQIGKWVEELKPDLIIGESLGALQAMRIKNVPLLFVSPALNAPFHFQIIAWLSLIPGMTLLFDRIYRPREGDRQKLHFTFRLLRKYRAHRKIAIETALSRNNNQFIYAFFGTHDHYRKYGVVSIRTWKKHFGRTYLVYDGTHFMEEEPIRQHLIPWVNYLLKRQQ